MSVPSSESRLLLYDVSSAFFRSLADAMMMCSLVTVGIRRLCGKHFTVLYIRVDTVTSVQMLWQR